MSHDSEATSGEAERLAALRIRFERELREERERWAAIVAVATTDANEMRSRAVALAKENDLLRVTLRSIGDGVITTDDLGNVTWLNPAAEHMTQWPALEASGRPIGEIFSVVNGTTHEPVSSPVTACLTEGRRIELADGSALVARNGDELPIDDSASPIRGDGGELLGAVVVFHDATEQRRVAADARVRAMHDALTGLPNRAAVDESLPRLISEARCTEGLVVFFLDLDHFKPLNDTLGHSAGDRILKAAALRMRGCVRSEDFVGRLGGDEFLVVSGGIDHAADVDRIASKLLAAIAEPMRIPGLPDLVLTASIGISVFPDDGLDAQTLIHRADLAMYRAKQRSRNAYERFAAADRRTGGVTGQVRS